MSLFLLLAALAFPLCNPSTVLAAQNSAEECVKCHQKDYDDGMGRRYIHAPFQKKKCLVCHVAGSIQGQREQEKKDEPEAIAGQLEWLARKHEPALIHWVVLARSSVGGIVIVSGEDDTGQSFWQKIPFPEFEETEHLPNDRKPPALSAVRVLDVKQGLFVSATIGWKTDEIADSLIAYGIGEKLVDTARHGNFTNDHRVAITGLKANQVYRFQVESRDIFGDQAVSGIFTFSTARPFSIAETKPEIAEDVLEDAELTPAFFRIGENYVLRLAANRPITLAVGTVPFTGMAVAAEKKRQEKLARVKHVPMTNRDAINLAVCVKCHAGCDHPLDVVPPPNMAAPAGSAMLDNGGISCMTCHARHASDTEFRLTEATLSALCVGCHKEKGKTLAQAPPLSVGKKKRILFVDDDQELVASARQILEQLGYEVSIRTDGAGAVAFLRAEPENCDLVILDQFMPDIKGAELAVRLQAVKEGLLIIMSIDSGAVLPEVKGVRGYIRKPFDKEAMNKAIRQALLHR